MLVSRCCKEDIEIIHCPGGIDYYQCAKCQSPTRGHFVLYLAHYDDDGLESST